MSLTGNRAYVNCSQVRIPLYTSNDMKEQIGTIYNSEMYSVSPVPGALPDYPFMVVTFRDRYGNKATGVMQTGALPFSTEPEYIADQVLFHRRNSNGQILVTAEATTIVSSDSNKYMIFTVQSAVTLHDVDAGTTKTLATGTRIAMDGSTVGVAHPDWISVDYVEERVGGKLTWIHQKDSWVELRYDIGSSPNNRVIW